MASNSRRWKTLENNKRVGSEFHVSKYGGLESEAHSSMWPIPDSITATDATTTATKPTKEVTKAKKHSPPPL